MPRKKGTVATNKVKSSWGKSGLEELAWFSQTLGIVWSSTVAYDLQDYSSMELDPYKSITYTLLGKGPDGNQIAEATIIVDFEHEFEKPLGYDSSGRGWTYIGINPQIAVPSKDRWKRKRAMLVVSLLGEVMSPREYESTLREAEYGRRQVKELTSGIEELDWD